MQRLSSLAPPGASPSQARRLPSDARRKMAPLQRAARPSRTPRRPMDAGAGDTVTAAAAGDRPTFVTASGPRRMRLWTAWAKGWDSSRLTYGLGLATLNARAHPTAAGAVSEGPRAARA